MANLAKQIKTRFSLPIIGFLFLVSSFGSSGMFSGVAHAASGANNDIADRVFSFQAYQLMTTGGCIWQDGDGNISTGTETWMQTNNASRLLGGTANNNATNINRPAGSAFMASVGVTDPKSAGVSCDNANGWVDKAIGLWGFSSGQAFLDALVATGAGQGSGGSPKGMRQESNGGYTKLGSSGVSSDLNDVIKQTLQKTSYYSGSNLGGLSSDEFYYDVLMNFKTQCDASFDTLNGKRNSADNVTTKTQAYDSSGKLVDGYWHYTTHGQIDVGSAIGTSDGQSSCENLAKFIADAKLIAGYSVYVKAGGTPVTTDPTPAANSGGAAGSCYAIVNPLTWILCPILDLADGIYGWLTSYIQSLLNIEDSLYNTSSLKESWAAMRNVASSLIVLVALAMIASQIFSFEFLSAYTVKKVLPRLIIAAIAIQLSWFIFTTMIVIMNGIGMGIYSLLLAPFHLLGAGSDIVDMLGAQSEGAKLFSGTLAIAAGAGGFVAVGGLAGMVGAAIAVIVSILTALVTLILRKMLIIVLLVLAPLALVAWILPGTQKYWDAWWKLFIRLLLMFPLIMVLIASGKIFASLMKDNPNAATPLIVVIAYFIPLFFIPATFKFAGGIFATTSSRLSGMSSKWGKQGGDLAKKKVGDYASNNYQNNGNRWKNGLARATTGNVGLTKNGRYRQRALIANRGAKYSSEREAEDNSLVESEIYGMDYDQKIQHLQDKIADTSLTSREKGAYAAKLTGLGKGEKLSDSFAAAGTALGEQQRTQLAEVLRKKADVAKEYAIKRPDVTFELGTKKYGGETPDGEWETKLGGYLASMEADKVAQLSPDFFKKPESVAKLGPRKADGTRDDVKADKLLADVQRMPIYGQLKGPARDVIDAAADRDSARRASSGGGSTTPPAAPGGTGSGGGGIPPTSGGSGGSPPPPAAPPTPRPTPQPGGSSGQSGPTFGP